MRQNVIMRNLTITSENRPGIVPAFGFPRRDQTPARAVGSEPGFVSYDTNRRPGFQWKAGPGRADAAPVPETPLLSIFRPVQRPNRVCPGFPPLNRLTASTVKKTGHSTLNCLQRDNMTVFSVTLFYGTS
jgi:hypothetical protein